MQIFDYTSYIVEVTAVVLFLLFFPMLLHPFLQGLTAGMPSGDYGDLGGNLPVVSILSSSYSTSMSLPSPYLFVPPAARKTISDVRRTFCLFVTFDLLFISLLWIIELNVSFRLRMCCFCRRSRVRVPQADCCLF